MALLQILLVSALLATSLLVPPAQRNGTATEQEERPNVPPDRTRSCAVPKRETVTEALNELFTCLVMTHIDGSETYRQVTSQPNFGRLAGSGATQGRLLAGRVSTVALISASKSHRLFYDLEPLFPPEQGRNESRGPEAAAKIYAYLSHLEESPYVVDTYRTLAWNDALPYTVLNVTDFVRDVLFNHWFKQYARQAKQHSQGLMDSSGFGHVFVGEYRSTGVTGFHNWLSIVAAEERGEFEYKGFVKVAAKPLMLASIQFSWFGKQKPLSSFAFGVETEFQLALFSACFVVKPGRKVRLRIRDLPVAVQTYTVNHQPESVGSAYFVL